MDYEKCFLCGRNRNAGRLEVHHIFQNAYRDKADFFRLTVLLCPSCHREGPFAAHRNGQTMKYLHQYGQRKAMKEQGWTVKEFMEVFGQNYLDEECP